MKKIGIISLISWMLFRQLFHSFSFDDSAVLRFLYYGCNDLALIGLFSLLLFYAKGIFSRLIKVSLIYAGFCLCSDILMLLGVGAHDFWLYTAISLLIIALGTLWVIYA